MTHIFHTPLLSNKGCGILVSPVSGTASFSIPRRSPRDFFKLEVCLINDPSTVSKSPRIKDNARQGVAGNIVNLTSTVVVKLRRRSGASRGDAARKRLIYSPGHDWRPDGSLIRISSTVLHRHT